MQLIQDCGAEINYSDPYVLVFPKMLCYSFNMNSMAISENIKTYDYIIVSADHVDFDYKMIRENAKIHCWYSWFI